VIPRIETGDFLLLNNLAPIKSRFIGFFKYFWAY